MNTDVSKTLKNVTARQLVVFSAVARHLSFTAAAKELHLTQPAVSMQMRELEVSCGIPLVEKIGRRIHLTEAGDELALCAKKVAEQLRETRERLDSLRGLKTGVLKLGAVSTAKYFAPSLLSRFKSLHPDVMIRFSVGNREEMIRQLAGNETDLVIMGRPPSQVATVAVSFAKHPFVVIAAPPHPLSARRRIPLRRLEHENFLIREPGSGTRAAMEDVFRKRGVAYQASLEVSSNETIKQAVIAGMGISFLSAHTVGLELVAGKLIALDIVGMPLLRDWFVIHLKSKRLSPVASAFRDFVLDTGADIIRAAVNP